MTFDTALQFLIAAYGIIAALIAAIFALVSVLGIITFIRILRG